MGVQRLDWVALAPVLAPIAAFVVVLVVDAIGPRRAGLARVHDLVALAGLIAAGAAVLWLVVDGGTRATLCMGDCSAGPEACSFVVSSLTLALQAIVVVAAVVTLLLAMDGDGAADRTPHHMLFLAAVTGAMALAGARDLASLVVAFETASLPAIGLVALRRDTPGAQAGVSLLLTAVGSLGLLLFGTALLLWTTGSLHLSTISAAVASPALTGPVRTVAVLGILLGVAGIAFKLSLVPFHLWTPDTYAGAPMPITAFLGVVSKTAGLAAVVVLLAVGTPGLAGVWAPVVGVLAAVTVTVGNLVALRQTMAIRLLAWSTVAQAGWVVLPLAGVRAGSPESARVAASASVGYLAAYVVATLAVFSVVIVVSRRHPAREEHTLDCYRGLARREPVAAGVLGLGLLALAGLPPGVVGLVAKILAVRPVVDSELWVIALVAAVNVALGVAYYLRWVALLVSRPVGAVPSWRVSTTEGIALGGSAAALVAVSVAPQLIAGLVPGLLR
jgi:NADH-quinone oxidoreductase subunit N